MKSAAFKPQPKRALLFPVRLIKKEPDEKLLAQRTRRHFYNVHNVIKSLRISCTP